MPWHNINYYAIMDSLILECQEVDSLMHIYNKDGKLVKRFGRAGQFVNNKRILTNNYQEAKDQLHYVRAIEGYYTDIYYCSTNNLIFRCYNTGQTIDKISGILNVPRRMQIYKQDTLISDIEVPIGFEIIGEKDGFYFGSTYVDEVNDIIKIYKFNSNILN